MFVDLDGPIDGVSVTGDALGLTDGLGDGLCVGLSYEDLLRDRNDMNVSNMRRTKLQIQKDTTQQILGIILLTVGLDEGSKDVGRLEGSLDD